MFYESDEVDLVHDLMAAMRSRGLSPIWPSGGRTIPLQEQLVALSSLEIPIISDTLPRHGPKFKSRSSHLTPLRSRDVISLPEKLKDLCDGLCLDCLKVGTDVVKTLKVIRTLGKRTKPSDGRFLSREIDPRAVCPV